MFKLKKLLRLAMAGELAVTLALCGCSSLETGIFGSGKLDGPTTVPDKYIFFPKPSEELLNREQNTLTNMMVALESQNKTPQEKAELFYGIGAIYDELGLESMARFMYMNSIVQNPTYYRPYEVLGTYFYKDGKVGDAVDALSSALDLNTQKDDPYIHLHRGIIMYYTGHDKYAYLDMRQFFESEPEDPYKMLCYYFAAYKYLGDQTAQELLSKYYDFAEGTDIKKNWGFNFVKLYLHKISVSDIFEDIIKVRSNADLFQDHLCEAYFYVGKYELQRGNDKLAYDYFKLCEAARKYGFLEHRLAAYEMDLLEKKYNIKKPVSVDSLTD